MKNILPRYYRKSVKEDLKDRMVFFGGPRQYGKTIFALSFLPEPSEKHPAYLNWDNISTRSGLLKVELPGGQRLIILDEIHKYSGWRGQVKGLYDTNRTDLSFIITGSARLDYYRKGGDSLQGRYHYYRLHAFSLGELNSAPTVDDFNLLFKFGGFP
jgi:predicted AAA+ superfamily ATPase